MDVPVYPVWPKLRGEKYWPELAPGIIDILAPAADDATRLIGGEMLSRLSPATLYDESVLAILHPTTRTLGPVYLSQLQGAVMGAPLPFGESVLIAWPQIVGLVAATILLFVAGYVVFQRQEVRA